MGSFMQIVERDLGDVTILELKGRMVLDEGDIPLRKDVNALLEHGRVKLVLDLHDVSRLDSAGIGTLVSSYISAHRRGGAVKLLHVTARANRLLNMTKLSSVFEIFDTEEEALESFRPH